MKISQNYQVPPTTFNRATPTPPKEESIKMPTDTYEKGSTETTSGTYANPTTIPTTSQTMPSQTADTVTDEAPEEESTDLDKVKIAIYVSKAKSDLQESQIKMLRDMASGNTTNQANQANQSNSKTSSSIVSSELPPTATTPEGAAAAIAPGGAYSVEAVSGRIMNMAKSFVGENANPEAIESMREAVIKGFEEAGLDIETGEGLPQICLDTFNETMRQFDEWKASTSAKVATS
ncbi:hypothetical protein AN639_10860 [Candidatus Epulonipiscium fishelsonii]|uniref:Uncharacterized protein n=1 Tax=Candidatus Epulonipiscium fishelsonii TaxID=77094 RepID=A0ACC8XEL4_9FIRM|nr:hypothetical protein AN396_03660 [Epulopiscium sp. SCG-B11WGA-EpuloA1]ONI43232.1 hypothetical protein AN639_10860 [Epulopiscium sp. SCG-B05WGA-EpuloA1]